jgi:predicted nuclease of predicted toxin-antitoxin system
MRVLLDECLPSRLKRAIPGHDVSTVSDAGWAGKSNGELLSLAVDSYDVFVTIDRNLAAQQNLERLAIGMIVMHAVSNRF